MPTTRRTRYNGQIASEPDPIDPYVQLAGAFLQRVLWDAQCQKLYGVSQSAGIYASSQDRIQQAALEFLEDTEAVAFWCELAGAEAALVLPAIQRAMHQPSAGASRRRGEQLA